MSRPLKQPPEQLPTDAAAEAQRWQQETRAPYVAEHPERRAPFETQALKWPIQPLYGPAPVPEAGPIADASQDGQPVGQDAALDAEPDGQPVALYGPAPMPDPGPDAALDATTDAKPDVQSVPIYGSVPIREAGP